MTALLTFGGQPVEFEIRRLRPLEVAIGGSIRNVTVAASDDPRRFAVEIDGVAVSGWLYRTASELYVRCNGTTTIFGLLTAAGSTQDGNEDEILADMPGVLVSAHCEPGQSVSAGERLIVIESMKLQTTNVAPRDAVIAAMPIGLNASFERRATLVSFVPRAGRDRP